MNVNHGENFLLRRQLALLATEWKRSQQTGLLESLVLESATRNIGPWGATKHGPYLLSQPPPSLADIVWPATTPVNCPYQLGSTALETPSVEPAPGYTTPRHGPVGAGRTHRCPSADVFQVFGPTVPFLLQPHPQLPSKVPTLEDIFRAWESPRVQEASPKDFRRSSIPSPSTSTAFNCGDSYGEPLLQEFFTALGISQTPSDFQAQFGGSSPICRVLPSRVTVPPFRPLPRRVADPEPAPSRPSPLKMADVSLFNSIDFLLDQLNGTTYAQQRVWEQLQMLSLPGRFSESVPTLVECLVDHGINRGCPSNFHIANFCGYILDRISANSARSGDHSLMDSSEGDVRSAFLTTFKQSWTPPPKPGSLSFKFIMRVASFYGYLYSINILNEVDIKACINFLTGLSPLPSEGLRALLSGDIEGHQMLAV